MEKSNSELYKIIFELRQEFDNYKIKSEKEIFTLNKKIEQQSQELKEKDNTIKVLNTTISELKTSHNRIVNILKLENQELKKENRKLKQELKEIKTENRQLKTKINKLEKENQKLKNQKVKDSHNSSKPSSTDGFHKVVHGLRKKSDKKVGGQQGHVGDTLTVKEVKDIIDQNKDNVILKSKTLKVNNPKLDGRKKYEVDTETKIVITEITLEYDKAAGVLPAQYKNDVLYGNNIKSLVVLLNAENAVSVSRTKNLISEITKGIINLSTGTICNFSYEAQKKIQPSIISIKEYLLRQEVAHKDETMLHCDGNSLWFHVFSNNKATYYYNHEKRGNIADIEKGLLRIFTGILVHDHMKGLYRFVSDDAECNAHILRYLEFAVEQYKRQWAKDLIDLLLEIKKEIRQELINGNMCLRTESILKYEKRYSDIIESGFHEFVKDNNKYKDYNGDDMKLLRRLKEYKDNHLAFMYDFRIPFDNNLAERDLRMIKAKKKISGCFRSQKGANAYTDIKSYLSTMRKQGKNLLESLSSAFEGNPVTISNY